MLIHTVEQPANAYICLDHPTRGNHHSRRHATIGRWRLGLTNPTPGGFQGGVDGKLTNTVVYANESEHNPQQASLKTRAGYSPENRSSLAAYVRTRTRTNVLPRVLPPADQKTASFRGCTQPAGWDSCSTRHQYTIGMVSECTDVQRVVRYVGVRCHTCRPAPANQLQIHATKYEAPGLLSLATNSRSRNHRYFN